MTRRTLVVMRHAHAAEGAWADHARPLTPRGQQEARAQGDAARRLGWSIDHVLCSDASRTRETLERFQQTLGLGVPCVVTPRLYLPSLRVMLDVISAAPDVESLWIVSHNPTSEELVRVLGGAVVGMPPGTMVRLHGEGASWVEALEDPWTLDEIVVPSR